MILWVKIRDIHGLIQIIDLILITELIIQVFSRATNLYYSWEEITLTLLTNLTAIKS